MVVYNFKTITVVPGAKDLIDIVLSRTQRKTPTVIRAGYEISRIRRFYMRKVKYTQQTFNEKLTAILDEFPKIDDIHPFYADLINVLYDRDHYKLALGQIHTARNIIDGIGKDYVGLLKYGDSLFRCKQLKRAALGRMCTLMKKQGPSMEYLEEVRKHLSRLPSINPSTRTILVCGYPNVGKSSFMNKTTRADVDVQPYAFTTKSLFVGHFFYGQQPWQAIDTPGILDHPLDERNTIEMQSITALAHLQAAVMFFIDISEQCGFSIEQQCSLFDNIRPLFANKPLLIVATKIDQQPWDTLAQKHKDLIEEVVRASQATFLTMSNVTEEGVTEVKNTACKELLKMRVERKMKSHKVGDILNRISVTMPKPRDGKTRGACIPDSVKAQRAAAAAAGADEDMIAADGRAAPQLDRFGLPIKHKDFKIEEHPGLVGAGGYRGDVIPTGPGGKVLLKDVERAAGGPGVFRLDMREHHILADEEHRYDVRPEIIEGKNVLDMIDPDILKRLQDLEEEEEARDAEEGGEEEEISEDEDAEEHELAEAIRKRKGVIIQKHRQETGKNRSVVPRKFKKTNKAVFEDHLRDLGVEPQEAASIVESRSKKRGRSPVRPVERVVNQFDRETGEIVAVRSRSRSINGPSLRESGVRHIRQKTEASKRELLGQRDFQKAGAKGEGDRFVGTKMPKHLFTGKRGLGKSDRR